MNKQSKTALLLFATVTAVLTAKAADYPRVILAQHPVAYYRLDEPPGAALAHDLSPAHSHATVNAASGIISGGASGTPAQGAALLPAISTNSAVFSGGANSASITIPYSTALSPVNSDGLTGGPFSCECWVRPAAAAAVSGPMCPLSMAGVAIGGNYASGSGWDFTEAGSPAKWQLTMRSQQGVIALAASTAVTAAQWNHLAVTWDGTTAKFYVNGAAAQSKPVPGYLAVPNFAGTIGSGPNTGGENFEGAVAEVAFYNYALHPAAISNHFALGNAIISARAAITSTTSTTNP